MTYFAAAFTAAGYFFGIKKMRWCWLMWFCANLIWVVDGVCHDNIPLILDNGLCCILALVGWSYWKNEVSSSVPLAK